MKHIRIGLDYTSEAEGQPALHGAIAALKEDANIEILIAGNEKKMREFLPPTDGTGERLRYLYVQKPSKGAPLRALTEHLQAGNIDVLVTANNTKLVVVSVKSGIGMCTQEFSDPPIIIPIPWIRKSGNKYVTGESRLLDAGANTSCTEQNLQDFEAIAKLYAQQVLKITNPVVARLTEDAYPSRKAQGRFSIMAPFQWIRRDDKQYHFGWSYLARPNKEATPETIVEAAIRAKEAARLHFNAKDAKIALVNIGKERNKGRALEQETYKLLEDKLHDRFAGNAEPEPMFSGFADIYVTDDFTAQLIQNLRAELTHKLFQYIDQRIAGNPRAALGNLLLLGLFSDLKSKSGYLKKELPHGVFGGRADIYVTDGFTGNILLKTGETVLKKLFEYVRKEVRHAFPVQKQIRKIGASLLKPSLQEIIKAFEPSTYGGAPMLGLQSYVIKCHGNSDAKAFANAIKEAANYARSGVIDAMKKELVHA